jgi:hypothetical protein
LCGNRLRAVCCGIERWSGVSTASRMISPKRFTHLRPRALGECEDGWEEPRSLEDLETGEQLGCGLEDDPALCGSSAGVVGIEEAGCGEAGAHDALGR